MTSEAQNDSPRNRSPDGTAADRIGEQRYKTLARQRIVARRWRVGGLLVVIALSALIWIGFGALIVRSVR